MLNPLIRGIFLPLVLLALALPAWAQDARGVGVITALAGRADLKRPQAPEAALKLRDNLFVRDVVDTHKESLARVLLLGKATVTIRELSRFEIREETNPDGSQRALINLAAGKIRVMVASRLIKPGDEVRIQTPNAIAGVRGTDGVFEVTTLPDGRPETVITGVSGEFRLTLPATPPFVARGKEFLDGPAHAAGAPLIAMADVVSDAPGIRVAQGPAGLSITQQLQARITGSAGAQALFSAFLPLSQLRLITAPFQLSVGASGASQPPPAATDRVVNASLANAQAATLASGLQPVQPPVGLGSWLAPILATPILPTTGTGTDLNPGTGDTESMIHYDQLGRGNKINAHQLRKADIAFPGPPAPLTLNEIAERHVVYGTGWGKIAQDMNAEGRIQETSLGQVKQNFPLSPKELAAIK